MSRPLRDTSLLLLLTALLTHTVAQTTHKINCGGPALDGYVADDPSLTAATRAFVAAYTASNASGPPTVYDSHAYAVSGVPLVYTLPVDTAVNYTVTLKFAENWFRATFPRFRVLNVSVNGRQIATNFDVWSRAGGNLYTPVDLNASNIAPIAGAVQVRIAAVVENAFISAIDVSPVPGTTSSSAPASNSTANATAVNPPASNTTAANASAPNPRNNSTTTNATAVSSPTSDTVASNSTAPERAPLPPPLIGSGAFRTVNASGSPTARHESCAVMVGGRVYIVGGRGVKPVDVYDPSTNAWTKRAGPGFEVHHMQCVAYQDRYIYMAGAWTGGFPNEIALNHTVRYDTIVDAWTNETGLGARARGGGAVAFYDGKLYLAMGNRGGHGAHATTLAEFDIYDPLAKTWTALPDAPDPRDHVGGAVVGHRFCIAGGRDGGAADFWRRPVTRVNCFNFVTGAWERRAHLPYGRAGAATGGTCQGLLFVVGGEGIPFEEKGKAYDRADLYRPETDSFAKPVYLRRARHGTGLAVADCACGNVYVPSGSGGLGGGPELTSMEVWSPDAAVRVC